MNQVHIIGGGLAGLSLGIALRKLDVPVRISEAGQYPRHRVCGEFLCGLNEHTREVLDLQQHLDGGVINKRSRWYVGGTLVDERELPEPVFALSRHALDAAMARQFQEDGGELLSGVRLPLSDLPEGTVNAAGRFRSKHSKWVGLKMHFAQLPMAADLEMHLGVGGYAGLARIERGLTNVCALLPQKMVASAARGRNRLADSLVHLGLSDLAERLNAAEGVADSLSSCAGFRLGWHFPESTGKGITLGDGLAMIPPFTGNGMSMALASGPVAAPFLAEWARGKCLWSEARASIGDRMQEEFHRRMTAARLLQPLLVSRLGGFCLNAICRLHLLPFRPLYHVTHHP